MLKKIVATLASLLFMTQSFAGNATLSINVGGAIWAVPHWKVGTTSGTTVAYNFASYTLSAAGNVDSPTQSIQLVLDPNAPVTANVALLLPTGCKIGTTALVDANTVLVVGTVENSAGNVLSSTFSGSAGTTTNLRFKNVAAGVSGSVACGTAGSLTYTY